MELTSLRRGSMNLADPREALASPVFLSYMHDGETIDRLELLARLSLLLCSFFFSPLAGVLLSGCFFFFQDGFKKLVTSCLRARRRLSIKGRS